MIPPFILKNREVSLPSMSIKKQAMGFMDDQKEQRVIVYEDEHEQE